MARAWVTRPLFSTCDEYPGTDVATRKALGMMNKDNPSVLKILQAAKSLGIKAESPTYRENCWAHIGLPRYQIAIMVLATNNTTWLKRHEEKWASHRVKFIKVLERYVERKTVDEVAKELADALKSLGKRV